MTEPNTTSTEDDAISALKRLGLSKYEAEVFIALQKLAIGTASEINRITDVPRSQVYGAAERLETLGLLEVQQSNPIQYRAIDLDEARERLRTRLDEAERHAFDHLETVHGEFAGDDETQEDIWTVQGIETVSDRIVSLAAEADERIVFGAAGESLLSDAIIDALAGAAERGIAVIVVSEDPTVCERFDAIDGITTQVITDEPAVDQRTARVLTVDTDTVLISVFGNEAMPEIRQEAAIWSTGTGFAVVLIGLLDGWLEQQVMG